MKSDIGASSHLSSTFWRCILVSIVIHSLIWIDVPTWISWVLRVFNQQKITVQLGENSAKQIVATKVSLVDKTGFSVNLVQTKSIGYFPKTVPTFVRQQNNAVSPKTDVLQLAKISEKSEEKKIEELENTSLNRLEHADIASDFADASVASEFGLTVSVASTAAITHEASAPRDLPQVIDNATLAQKQEEIEPDSAILLGQHEGALVLPSNTHIKYRFLGLAKGLLYRVGGELIFKKQGAHGYQLTLEADSLLGGFKYVSAGQMTGQGLLPERYLATIRRGFSSQQQAINFQRDKQQLTGKRYEASLSANMDIQDVLSNSVQLGMLLIYTLKQNDVRLPVKFTMHVASISHFSRWIMLCDRYEQIGSAQLIHCVREQQKGDEKRMEIWYNLAQQGFPARVSVDQNNGDWIEQIADEYGFIWDEERIRNERK